MYNFSKSLWIAIILASSCCIIPQVQANTPATSMTQPLAYYINANEVEGANLRLANGTDQVTAVIPISSRSAITGINIHIKFINSISLSKDRSQIRFRFNGQVIGQVPLDPLYPEGSINLSIPKDMVRAGNNQLVFESSLHTAQADAALYSSELWTEIDTKQSTITISSKAKGLNTQLSGLPGLVHGTQSNGHFPLSVLTAGDFPSDQLMNAASYMVQGLAQFTAGVPLQVTAANITAENKPSSQGLLALNVPDKNNDIVLLGTIKSLGNILGTDFFANMQGETQWLSLHSNPRNTSRFVLVVAGETEQDVLAMAQYFTNLNIALVDQSNIGFNAKTNAVVQKTSAHPSAVESDMHYTFAQLGMKTTVLTGINDAAELHLKLPADLFAISDEDLDVMLHITYSAFLGEGSSISVLLNDEFQHSIPLTNPMGMHVNSWKLAFPLRAFHRGMNTIRFQGHIAPSAATKEHQHMLDSIKVTLFEDSIVRIPSMSHYARLPDLKLLQSTGYPYIEDGKSVFYVPSQNTHILSAALTLVSKLVQQQGHTTDTIWFSNDFNQYQQNNLFVFTPLQDVPQQILTASPLTILDNKVWLPLSDAFEFSGVPKNILTSVLASGLVLESFTRLAQPPVLQEMDIDTYGLITQFESPFHEGRSITMVTSPTSERLVASVNSLVMPAVWQDMRKDTFVWGINTLDNTNSFKVSDEYHTGELSFFGKIAYHAVTSPIYLLLLIISLVVLLTWLTRQLLLRHDMFHSHH